MPKCLNRSATGPEAPNVVMPTMPPSSRSMNVEAFGQGADTWGFGLLTWNDEYCRLQGLLACPGANYLANAHLYPHEGGPPYWGYAPYPEPGHNLVLLTRL